MAGTYVTRNFRLRPEEDEAFNAYCKAAGKDKVEVFRAAVEEYMKAHPAREEKP